MNGIQCVYTPGDKGLTGMIRLCWNEFINDIIIIGIRTWECFGEWSLAVQYNLVTLENSFIYYCKC